MKTKKLFLIIGAPGSGKTTDAELVAKRNKSITHYSTGDMLRSEVASGSKLGKEINSYISKGLIVPIKIAIATITNAILNADTDVVILDGYPRSIEQMDALENFLNSNNSIKLTNIIELKVSEETARERVLGRARGEDDNAKIFNNRMRVYIEPLEKIQTFYSEKGLLEVISGEGTIESIVTEMESFIISKI